MVKYCGMLPVVFWCWWLAPFKTTTSIFAIVVVVLVGGGLW